MISPELRAEIRRLFFAEHWKVGTISEHLKVHHSTVHRAIESHRFLPGARPVRPSGLDRFKPFIIETLKDYPKLRATRIHHMLTERGYTGSATTVRRYVKRIRPSVRNEAFLRIETLKGEQGQVDWGHFGKIEIGRARRSLSCFVMVLSNSRATFARFSLDQTLESFIAAHVAAFEAFGGAPREILYDNLKTAVLERQGDLIRFHPTLLELAGHYHFAPKPCAPYRANEKGKIERTIQYLRRSFFDARPLSGVAELNIEVASWVDQVAHQRPWPGRGENCTVADKFSEEQPHLLPLPENRFEAPLTKPIRSGKTPYVRFDLNDYSIPFDRVRKQLTVVANESELRILDGAELVAKHTRSYDRGRQIEQPEHIEALHDHKRHARQLRGRDRLFDACSNAQTFLQALADRDIPIRPQTARLNLLLERYGADELSLAIDIALDRGAVAASSVDQILDQRHRAQGGVPRLETVLPDDPRVQGLRVKEHDLASYDTIGMAKEDSDESA